MKKLSKTAFKEASEFIKEEGRLLEKAVFTYRFEKPNEYGIIDELKKFQNEDGGFGNALEPDFRLSYSSPMATSVALQHLITVAHKEEARSMIKAAVEYLEDKYDEKRHGWYAVPKSVNDYPHTPWWEYNDKTGRSVIDENWGNPSAELIGYLYKYRIFLKKLNADNLVDYAINYFNNLNKTESFHEVYCFIRLHKALPADKSAVLEQKIKEAVDELVCRDSSKWKDNYVAKPLDFVFDRGNKYGISDELIDLNLDFLVDTLERDKIILPSWGDSFYTSGLKPAWKEWIGVGTLKALIVLDKFNRI